MTTIYVTHDQTEAMAMGTRIAVMKEGKIQQVATPLEIYHRPANKFVAEFFGSSPMNFFHGSLESKNGGIYFENESLSFPIATVPLPKFVGKKITVGIRPENIALQNGESNSENSVVATVESIETTGAQTLLLLKNGSQFFTANIHGNPPVELNQKISFIFDASPPHFFDAETERNLS